MTIKLMTIKWW